MQIMHNRNKERKDATKSDNNVNSIIHNYNSELTLSESSNLIVSNISE